MTQQDQYFLSQGSHPSPDEGRCAMEWVSYLAGEPHSDRPVCVSPVLQSFCIALNDKLPDDERQKLRPYLARTIGTAGDGQDEQRLQILREWLIKTSLPRTLDLIGQAEWAARLRELPGPFTLEAVRRTALEVRDEARRARSEARAKLRAELRKRGAAAYAAAYAAAAYAADAAAAYAADDAAAYAAGKSPQEIYEDVYKRCRAAADERLAGQRAESQRQAFELLEQLLPKEIIQLPVVDDAADVCGIPVTA